MTSSKLRFPQYTTQKNAGVSEIHITRVQMISVQVGTEMNVVGSYGGTVADVLAQGEYLDMIAARYGEWEKMQYMKVNLSVPKFNIQSQRDLRSGLEQMGITELFDLEHSDFSTAFSGPAHITGANQAVRVEIDEQGVKAAAYIELPMAGAAAPPEEIIDFILDRPFLFLVADGTGIPLFAGTVNQP